MRDSCQQGPMPVQLLVFAQPCQASPNATPRKHLLLLTAMVLSWAALTPPIALRCPATCSRRAADRSSSSATRERSMPICTHCSAKPSGPPCAGCGRARHLHHRGVAHQRVPHQPATKLLQANWHSPAIAWSLTPVLSILCTLLLCLVAGRMQPGGITAQPPGRAEHRRLMLMHHVQACAGRSTQHGTSSPAVCCNMASG